MKKNALYLIAGVFFLLAAVLDSFIIYKFSMTMPFLLLVALIFADSIYAVLALVFFSGAMGDLEP